MKKNKIKNRSGKKGEIKQRPQLPKKTKSNRYWLGLALIVALGIILYSNSFDCTFHFDDTTSIVKNKDIRDVTDINSIWNSSTSRFIPYFSLAINYHFGELNVWGYHFVNLMIHLITACLVYWLTLLILSSPTIKNVIKTNDHKTLAFITGLLFVSHPLATQSVTYIVQRMASMVALFYLLTMCLYLKGRLNEKLDSSKKIYFIGALIAALCALLTKENAYTLPLAIILLEICFIQTKIIKIKLNDYRFKAVIIIGICFLLMFLSRMSLSIFNPAQPEFGNTFTVTPLTYLLTQFSVILNYIQLLVLPIGLNIDHDVPMANSLFELRTLASFLVLITLVGLGVLLFKRHKLYSFGIFWFFITISIESSIIPLADLMFDHRTYLPSFGFFLILSVGIYQFVWQKNKALAIGFLVLIIGSNSFLTHQRNKDWKNDYTLWTDAISKSPNKARPYATRGNYYKRNKKFNEAITDYNNALKINPKYAKALQNRGATYVLLDKWDKAIQDYTDATSSKPNYAIATFNRVNRGIAYLNVNQFDKALEDFSKAIELNYNHEVTFYLRGLTYSKLNQWEKAITDYDKSLKLNPNFTEAVNARKRAVQNLGYQ